MLCNDNVHDNWQGEYAILLAGAAVRGRRHCRHRQRYWPDLSANTTGWRDFVAAARASGIRNIPDPIASTGAPLTRPASGDLDATVPNRSEGAQLINDLSRRLSRSYRPLVIVTGASLTDVADAYLVDHTLADRVVVVSSLGTIGAPGGRMNAPNGQLDPWADAIVSTRLRYVQVSPNYDQAGDVPSSLCRRQQTPSMDHASPTSRRILGFRIRCRLASAFQRSKSRVAGSQDRRFRAGASPGRSWPRILSDRTGWSRQRRSVVFGRFGQFPDPGRTALTDLTTRKRRKSRLWDERSVGRSSADAGSLSDAARRPLFARRDRRHTSRFPPSPRPDPGDRCGRPAAAVLPPAVAPA